MKKGDTVQIVNKDHVGFGQVVTVLKITKHRHKTIKLYEVQNENGRWYCKKEDLEPITVLIPVKK